MAANQSLESSQFPTLRLSNQSNVCVLQRVDETHSARSLNRSLGGARKIHFIFFKDRRWLKIGLNSDPHLEGIREIIESCDHLAFQDLFLGEPKYLKLDNVLAGKL